MTEPALSLPNLVEGDATSDASPFDGWGGPSERRVSLAPPAADPAVPPALEVDTLVDIALGLARAEGLWRPHLRHDDLSRTSVRLLATPVYEVWLLGWTVGQGVDLHDHGGANAAFVVLDGELDELTLTPNGIQVERYGPGAVSTVAAGVVHDVLNQAGPDASSLHVYSNPLQSMTFFTPDGTPTHRELVEEVPAVLSHGRTARVLHPALGGT